MVKAHVEELNGAIMPVLPPTIVDRMRLSAGAEVEIEVKDDATKPNSSWSLSTE